MKRLVVTALAVLFITAPTGCSRNDKDTRKVDLDKRITLPSDVTANGDTIHIAVGSMLTPKAGFLYYKQLLQYIEDKLGRKVLIVDRENYAEINKGLESGEIDAAFVCSGAYVRGHRDFGLELLAVPVSRAKTTYRSYIIVPAGSPAHSLEDLRGKTFAFTDPLSNTGSIAPSYMLIQRGETPETFFGKLIFTYAHDLSVEAVAHGIVDGAAVDSLVWEYLNKFSPELTKKTTIIHRSRPFGIPPVVISPVLDTKTKAQLKKILLGMNSDPEGSEILTGIMIEGYVEGNDGLYDSIREMLVKIDEKAG